LYLTAFERRNIKTNGKCEAITRAFSQALFLGQHQAFLTNLETLSLSLSLSAMNAFNASNSIILNAIQLILIIDYSLFLHLNK
jgi:hypothetical protein